MGIKAGCERTHFLTCPTALGDDFNIAASEPYVETLPVGIALHTCKRYHTPAKRFTKWGMI